MTAHHSQLESLTMAIFWRQLLKISVRSLQFGLCNRHSNIGYLVPRYWAMKGYHVERRFGWDTHGVPIEYEIDKKLGMSGLQAVEEIGIEKYNQECRSIVMKFAGDWKVTIDRLGRWIDMEDKPYKVRHCFTKYGQLSVFLY